MMNDNLLIGKTINKVQITTDKLAIRFILSDGTEVTARTYAECCSSTWIEHVSLPWNGFPATVYDASDIAMPDSLCENECENEYIKHYGFCIKTDKGDMMIDYRNESNGYYGGSLFWPEENDDWRDITQDI